MGGGGGKILDSPKTGDNSEFEGSDDLENDNQKDTAWENPTFKTFEEYFTDLNITKDTITEEDYTGNGSLSNPYVVHSTKGFLYLMNYSLSNLSLINKYLELNCDIILNDETFDKDGNVYGGDGVVYNWGVIEYRKNLSFDGNNHIIKGYCVIESDELTGEFSKYLFDRETKIVENVVFENVYVYGGGCNNVSAVSLVITTISNVKMLSGVVIGNGDRTMTFASIGYYIYDSVNYCDVYSYYQGASGFVQDIYKEMKNCVNYGNILVENRKSSTGNGRGAGFVQRARNQAVVENCINYGEISARGKSQCGGIVSWGRGIIRNCINYGNIYCGSDTGGIVAYKSEAALAIISCKNYGYIFANKNSKYTCGSIFGSIGSDYINQQLEIRNCYAVQTDGIAIMGRASYKANDEVVDVSISNCKIDIVGNDYEVAYCLVGAAGAEYLRYNFSNIEINVLGTGCKKLALIYNKISLDSDKLNIKNVIVNVADGNANIKPTTYRDKGNPYINIDGVIFIQAGNMVYYGSDFSGFYTDWKSGKIGLKAIDGKGFYQGNVSESTLQEKGFVKKLSVLD